MIELNPAAFDVLVLTDYHRIAEVAAIVLVSEHRNKAYEVLIDVLGFSGFFAALGIRQVIQTNKIVRRKLYESGHNYKYEIPKEPGCGLA